MNIVSQKRQGNSLMFQNDETTQTNYTEISLTSVPEETKVEKTIEVKEIPKNRGEDVPYSSGKPKIITIRAKIIHDES